MEFFLAEVRSVSRGCLCTGRWVILGLGQINLGRFENCCEDYVLTQGELWLHCF